MEEPAMTKVGVIGLGMMGLTHLDAYKKRDDVTIAAISDKDPDRLSGKVQASGNVEGQAQAGVEALTDAKRYEEGTDLINDPDIDLVDICLPTHLHKDYAIAAMEAGKHVMIEKPLARTSADADLIVAAGQKAKGMAFVGMCMRFWPGWTWLKDVIDHQTYGQVLAATFRRRADHPGGGFYLNGKQCGGALLDLHIHDTDFIQYCFGIPKTVTTFGYKKMTGEYDHVITRYGYDSGEAQGTPTIVAEGCWAMAPGFGFRMTYTINFENATATFDMADEKPLTLYRADHDPEKVELDPTMGYDLEIAYFLDCIATGNKPATVTLEDAANTIKICEAEAESATTGKTVTVKV